MDNQTARIANATPTQLIQITYEIILNHLQKAKDSLTTQEITSFLTHIEQAQKLLRNLMESLDLSYDISMEIMSLYLYVNKLLIQASMQKGKEPIEQSEKILNNLLVAWRELAKQNPDQQGPVLENAQQVYAGLTYGKGTLNEAVIDPDNQKRGFKA
ncbi:MAG: flagellar protein FliS [Epulopiscium sp.]|nr:flagellar protein FliS [Candidatus Epulonipiscium sp.]